MNPCSNFFACKQMMFWDDIQLFRNRSSGCEHFVDKNSAGISPVHSIIDAIIIYVQSCLVLRKLLNVIKSLDFNLLNLRR